MYSFKALSVFLSLVASVSIPVVRGAPADVRGTSLDDLSLGAAGTRHSVGHVTPRATTDSLPGQGAVAGVVQTNDALNAVEGAIGSTSRLQERDSFLNLPIIGLLGLGGDRTASSTGEATGAAASLPPVRRQADVPPTPAAPQADTDSVRITEATDGVRISEAPPPPSTQVDQPATLPEVFQGAIFKLEPIIARLKASVSVKADIDVDLVVVILGEVIVVLNDIVVQLQAIVEHPDSFVLSLAGTILSLPQVVFVISSVVWLVTTALVVVVSAVATVDVAVKNNIEPLVFHIGSLLATVIGLALQTVDGLLPLLAAAVTPIAHLLWHLHIGQVATVLGISAPAGF